MENMLKWNPVNTIYDITDLGSLHGTTHTKMSAC